MKRAINDQVIEGTVSTILRSGVILSGVIVLAGGAYYLASHGLEATDYHHFAGQPVQDRFVGRILRGAVALRARSLIQLGILCLIATPIVRVAYSLVGFTLEGDRTYVVVTAIVLSILLFSLLSGAAGGI